MLKLFLPSLFDNQRGSRDGAFRSTVQVISLASLMCVSVAANGQSFEEALALHDAGNYEQAIAIFMARAEEGEASSMYNVAEMHRHGLGTDPDPETAVRWYMRAAEAGHEKAREHGLETIHDLVEQGSPFGRNALGNAYLFGDGAPRDPGKASEHFRLAASMGYVPAMMNLAQMHDRGVGMPQDFSESFRWYCKAAAAGDQEALFNVGAAYYNGQGVERDLVSAYAVFNVLAANGDAEGKALRDRLLAGLSPNEVRTGQRMARKAFTEGVDVIWQQREVQDATY